MDLHLSADDCRHRAAAIWIVALVLSAPMMHAQAPPAASAALPASLTLDEAFARAAVANPVIAAARLRRAVDVAGVDVAREHPNPEARIELERDAPTRSYGLAFPIELGGKRDRRVAVGEAAVRTGEAELTRTMVEIRSQVRRAYFARVVADARLAVLDDLRQLAERARDAARQRFDAGSAPRLEVLQGDLALAQAENEATAAGAVVRAATVRLNTLLGLPLDSTVALTTPLDEAGSVPVEAALARARAANAELALIDRRTAEARARMALAEAARVPDLVPEAAITRGAEPEFSTGWRASVGLVVPLFTTHRAAVRVEAATLAQLAGEREAVLAGVTGDVAAAAAIAEAQRLQYVRYRDDILPQAVQVEQMAEDSYRLGQTGISALLQALQASRDVRLRSLESASTFQDALVELERAIGAPIP